MPYLPSNPKRHPNNKKLRLFYEPVFRGRRIQHLPGFPMIENYLEKLWDVIELASLTYRRVYAVRVDLHFPQEGTPLEPSDGNRHLKSFFANLQRELHSAGLKYNTKIIYVWAREQKASENPHYHVLMMLNGDAIRGIGNYRESTFGGYEADNLYHRIARSWAGAIGLLDWQASGLVHLSKAHESKKVAQFFIGRNDTDFTSLQDDLFYAASYLCKAQTKNFAQQVHCFGSSQTRDLVAQRYPQQANVTPQSSRW